MRETVFVSGLYSGPSPSAGLGVARSLRAAFPSARLMGVDYWAGSSGLHHEVFDATWLKPPWDLIEEDLYVKEVQAELDRGALWIPTLDLEVAWRARSLPIHPLLLAPCEKALAPRPQAAAQRGRAAAFRDRTLAGSLRFRRGDLRVLPRAFLARVDQGPVSRGGARG